MASETLNSDLDQPLSERRYLTIVFVDLVGYTQLSEDLDPEDLRVLQRRYQNLALRVMERFGGFVARFTGDGILVYFGYPTAHENDAERALRASLELIDRLPTLDTHLAERTMPPLQARVGIHTGLVLIAPELVSGGPTEHNVFGEVVNLAARLQAEAPTNGVVVSKDTLDLVAGLFDHRPLGSRTIRGLSREVSLFHVTRARMGAKRSAQRFTRTAAAMIGREDALASILERYRISRSERRLQTVAVVGDAGVGKTRLMQELGRRPELADATVVQVSCHEIFASTDLYPLASYLWARVGLTVDDDAPAQAGKIASFLDEFDLHTPENTEIVASLLGLATRGVGGNEAETPAQQRRRQYEFVMSYIVRGARGQQIVLWIEDAHWLDPSSAEVLHGIVEAVRDTPFLLIFVRRSFPVGPELPPVDETIALQQLDDRTCHEIAMSIPGAETLGAETIDRAVAAAEGMPLFLEQFIISLIEEEQRVPAARHKASGVPLMLAEMMSERLDRRPGGRRIIQAAACIGRSFTPEFLAAMLQQDPSAIAHPLEALVEAELLLPRRYGGEIRYEFRHALLQRMAYESAVQTERRAMHARIVDVLQTVDESGPASPPEIVAHHLTEAGRLESAAAAWLRAGVAAAQRSAHLEAIQHLRRGLDVLTRLPEGSPLRRELEIKMQAALMASTLTTEGATSGRLSECCQRGLALCAEGEPSPLVLSFAFGQFTYLNCKGETEQAAPLARLFLSLAEQSGSRPGRAMGHLMLGRVMFSQARLSEALEHYTRALELCPEDGDGGSTLIFGQHIDVHVNACLSLLWACLGDVDRVIETASNGVSAAERFRHPHSTAIALNYIGGCTFWVLGPSELAVHEARRLIQHADEHRLRSFRAMASGFLGSALCMQGSLEEAEEALTDCIAKLDEMGFRLAISLYLARLAEVQRRLGKLEEAHRNCARAITLLRQSSVSCVEAELRRIEALIVADRTPHERDRAEQMLRDAVALAQKMQTPILERSCLLSLRDFLGAGPAASALEPRLAELAHLADAPDRVAAAIAKIRESA